MDWKELLASIIHTLAWPAVVVAIVVVLRKQFETLLARQDDATSSRDWKKRFTQFLNEGRRYAEWLGARHELPKVAAPAASAASDARHDSPVTIILLTYQSLLDILLEAKKALNLSADSVPQQIITALVCQKLLSDRANELFNSMTDARNAAIHCSEKDAITDGEANEYRLQADVMTKLLRQALSRPPAPSATPA